MDILERYKRDDKRIADGFKFELGQGAFIRVARLHESNPRFKKVTETLSRQRQHEIDRLKGAAKAAVFAEITEEAFAQIGITEIVGVTIGGEEIKADPTGIARIRSEVPELWNDLIREACTDANYIGSFDEDESVKN